MDEKPGRGPVLTIFAVLFTLLAISNISKPLSGGRGHFVFFGTRMTGTANAILGPLFGIYLLIYVVGIWRQKRWAVPMAWAYAAYVLINMALFSMKTPQNSWNSPVSAVVYVAIAIGVSWGAAILLTRHRAQLT